MPNIERNKRIIFNGVEMDYVVAINLIVDAWGKDSKHANQGIFNELNRNPPVTDARDKIVTDIITYINGLSPIEGPDTVYSFAQPPSLTKMNENVKVMLYRQFSSAAYPASGPPINENAPEEDRGIRYDERAGKLGKSWTGFDDYMRSENSTGQYTRNINPNRDHATTIDEFFESHINRENLSSAAADKLRRTSKEKIRNAWTEYDKNVRPGIELEDFLEDVLADTIDSAGSIEFIQRDASGDQLRDVFEQQGKLSFDSISPIWMEEWNKSAAIASQGYDNLLAKHRVLQEEMRIAAAANDTDRVNEIMNKQDQLQDEFEQFLVGIADNFPTEEQMKINKQVLTPGGRQQLFYSRAHKAGVGADGLMEGLPNTMAKAFQELEQQYLMAGPDADYSAMVDDYFGEGGEKFQSRFGVTPPAMPGLPDAKEAQRRYQEVVDRGGSAKEIMDVIQGLDPGAASESDLSNFIDDPNVLEQVRKFSANFDPEGLKNYLTGLYPDLGNQLIAFHQSELQAAQDDYAAGVIDQDQYNQISADLNAKIADPINTIDAVKITQAAMDENIKWTGDPGGDAYKGIYNPYEPPKEIDSRLYAPAQTNIGFQDLPPEGVPGTVRYDAEGNPLGPLYSDTMTEAQEAIDKRSAEMGISPEEYTPGDDPTLDAAYKSLDDAYIARSEAEAAIAADEPEEDDYLPPEPVAPAPEMTQFTTRTRGGRRGY